MSSVQDSNDRLTWPFTLEIGLICAVGRNKYSPSFSRTSAASSLVSLSSEISDRLVTDSVKVTISGVTSTEDDLVDNEAEVLSPEVSLSDDPITIGKLPDEELFSSCDE